MYISFIKLYFILACFLLWQNMNALPIIQVTFNSLENDYQERMERKLKKYGSLGKTSIHHFIDHNITTGLFASYAGFMGASDTRGIITFARKHDAPFVYILFTPEITPISMFHNTIHHWQLDPNQPAAMYKVDLGTNQEKKVVWHIESIPLPDDKIIPLETIIVFGDPKDFSIDSSGHTPVTTTPNMVLPPILVKKGVNIVGNSLYVLQIRQFFKTAHPIYQKQPDRYEIISQS
jgi:hypothetical protein